ncbi:MAG: hypothetical protein Q4F95_15610 [Oscillospiraceae bacterium]|nr:hypothetical protein [Oscillospiraceae bacterium]
MKMVLTGFILLLDELHLLSESESVLNGFMHIRKVDICVAGSNAGFLYMIL